MTDNEVKLSKIIHEQMDKIHELENTIIKLKCQNARLSHLLVDDSILIQEIHTFAKPDDVSDIKFGDEE